MVAPVTWAAGSWQQQAGVRAAQAAVCAVSPWPCCVTLLAGRGADVAQPALPWQNLALKPVACKLLLVGHVGTCILACLPATVVVEATYQSVWPLRCQHCPLNLSAGGMGRGGQSSGEMPVCRCSNLPAALVTVKTSLSPPGCTPVSLPSCQAPSGKVFWCRTSLHGCNLLVAQAEPLQASLNSFAGMLLRMHAVKGTCHLALDDSSTQP